MTTVPDGKMQDLVCSENGIVRNKDGVAVGVWDPPGPTGTLGEVGEVGCVDPPGCVCHPTAEIERGSSIGNWSRIWRWSHVRSGVKIGDHCVIGQGCFIDIGVQIGNHCHVQNGVSVYHGVTLEDEVFVGPNVTFTNDFLPRVHQVSGGWSVTPTLVKRGASIGAGSTIVCGVTIGEFAMIGAGSVVTRDVPPYRLVHGNPARMQGWVCQCGVKVADVNHELRGTVRCRACGKSVPITKQPLDK